MSALLEYVWVDASGNTRSKTKVLDSPPDMLLKNGVVKVSQLLHGTMMDHLQAKQMAGTRK